MALFDSLAFSPQSYQSGGGLLDMLKLIETQNQYQPNSVGLPDGSYRQGDVNVPVFGQPQATGEATLPQNATMTQGQIAQPQASNPLGAGFEGFINNLHTGPLGAVAGAIGGFAKGTTPENQTIKALMRGGIDEDTAKVVAQDPALLRAVLPQVMGIGGQTDDIKEYQFALKQGFKGSLADWMQRKRAGAGEYGLQGIWGTGADGKPALVQLGKNGEAVQSKMPEGFTPAKDAIKVDLGPKWGFLDPQTRQIVSVVDKDIIGKESQEEIGKARGQAQVNLPNTLAKAKQALDVIDKMIEHPGREAATGLSGSGIFGIPLDPRNWVAGTDATNFKIMSKQLEGKAFLEAFESLKGGGQITEVEGVKATQAIARLDRAQSDEEYLAALNELKEIITNGMNRAKQKAGIETQPVAQSSQADDGWKDAGNGVRIRKKQ